MAYKVLQWYMCRMEGWFAADADNISVQSWDEVLWRLLVSLGPSSSYLLRQVLLFSQLEDGCLI